MSQDSFIVFLNILMYFRYSTQTYISEYKKNLDKLCSCIRVNIPDCFVLWNTTLPVHKEAKGGVLIPEVMARVSMLGLEITEANFSARNILVQHGIDVIDLHYYLRNNLHRRAEDGVHWDMTAHRRITNILLTHITEAVGGELPHRVGLGSQKGDQGSNAKEVDLNGNMIESSVKELVKNKAAVSNTAGSQVVEPLNPTVSDQNINKASMGSQNGRLEFKHDPSQLTKGIRGNKKFRGKQGQKRKYSHDHPLVEIPENSNALSQFEMPQPEFHPRPGSYRPEYNEQRYNGPINPSFVEPRAMGPHGEHMRYGGGQMEKGPHGEHMRYRGGQMEMGPHGEHMRYGGPIRNTGNQFQPQTFGDNHYRQEIQQNFHEDVTFDEMNPIPNGPQGKMFGPLNDRFQNEPGPSGNPAYRFHPYAQNMYTGPMVHRHSQARHGPYNNVRGGRRGRVRGHM